MANHTQIIGVNILWRNLPGGRNLHWIIINYDKNANYILLVTLTNEYERFSFTSTIIVLLIFLGLSYCGRRKFLGFSYAWFNSTWTFEPIIN